jgi:hypothetical protein
MVSLALMYKRDVMPAQYNFSTTPVAMAALQVLVSMRLAMVGKRQGDYYPRTRECF